MDESSVSAWMQAYRDALDEGKSVAKSRPGAGTDAFAVDWKPYLNKDFSTEVKTGYPLKALQKLAVQCAQVSKTLSLQPQVAKEYEARQHMAEGKLSLHWGFAETLAYATLVKNGVPVRLCGQDSGRGTFSHRHAVLHDQKTGEEYVPLAEIDEKQATFTVIDSVLSEEAVLGFEYGFATAYPEALVLWEAQFGDFANGAQVLIDQFLSSGEQKWGRLCGLTLLLPHGFEGQGPEHSSARLERYLQLCAQKNMQVCVPTTPAQMFHLLRRQVLRPFESL